MGWALQEKEKQLQAMRKKLKIFSLEIELQAAELGLN